MQKKYKKSSDKNFRYDLMNYKYLSCNKVRSVEKLSFYISKNTFKKISLINFESKSKKYKIKRYARTRKKLRKKIKLRMRPKYAKHVGKHDKRLYWENVPFKKRTYLRFTYPQRVRWWDNRRALRLKFVKYQNLFNNEMGLLNYNKTYVYNRSKCNIVHINLTPNNVTIVVTRANGNVVFWGTSGTLNYHGSRKHTFLAVKAVGISVYKEILRRKIRNLKIVYRGKRRKIRMRELISTFSYGAHRRKYKIFAVISMSPLPYNGCRNRKKRR